jgi:hypothetical protein
MPKPRRKKKSPQRVLALPDLEQTKSTAINSLTSKSGQRTYEHAITEFVDWYYSEPRLSFSRTVRPEVPNLPGATTIGTDYNQSASGGGPMGCL